MHTEPDGQIADGLRVGNPHAWAALYQTHFDEVWRSVARLVGPNSADVADVVQETFLAAARSADSYDPDRGSLLLWLSGIARNHAGNHLRGRRRRQRLREGGDLAADVAERLARRLDGRDVTPPVALAAAEQAEAVRDALAELPKDYSSLLVAKYCDNATAKMIARAEDSSAGAIRSKLARARRAFREIFAKWSACDDDPAGTRHEQ
ncbi:MAG: RNA polymerase sigma factor [Candidatus Nealsonbacteria bacterium]|nr:RNA polymerase sigma factor [Candidatus Nealsonbacteria bacterium]